MKFSIYEKCKEFLNKYPFTICFRVKKHSKVIQKHLNPDEDPNYVFTGQKSTTSLTIFSTCVVTFTNKRMLVGHKRIVPGYFYTSVTPDMLNDFEIKRGIFFGKVYIDTIKEKICISDIDVHALREIEDYLSKYMLEDRVKFLKEIGIAK